MEAESSSITTLFAEVQQVEMMTPVTATALTRRKLAHARKTRACHWFGVVSALLDGLPAIGEILE